MHVRLMNRIYNTVFLFIVTITILFINVSKGQLTPSLPSLMLNNNMTISTPILTYGNVKQIRIQGGFIFRLSMSGKLMIQSAKKRTLLYRLFDGQSQFTLQKCVKFSLGTNNETLAVYTLTQKVFVVKINILGSNIITISSFAPQYNVTNSTTYTFRNIEIINNTQLVIFLILSKVKSLIQRFTLTGIQVGLQNKIVSANIQSLYEMKTCQIGYGVNNNGSFVYYVAVWKDDCYFQLQLCTVGGQCVVQREYQATACTQADLSSNLTTNYKLQFTPDCSGIIFSSKSQGYGVYNISQQLFSKFYANTLNLQFSSLSVFSTQGYGQIIHFTLNGVFFVNLYEPSIQSNTVNMTLPQYGQTSAMAIDNSYFLTANDTNMIFYNFYCQDNTLILVPSSFLCMPCPMYCQSCDSYAKCTLCSGNYTLNQASNSCVLMSNNTIMDNNTGNNTNSNTNNNSTVPNNNNQQNNNTYNSNTNNTNNNSNNTNNTNNTTTTPSTNLTIPPKFAFQSTLTNMIQSQSAQTVINASIFSLSMLQLFPFSFLFMRFINFWSICTYYLFLRVKMPTYLYDILYSIYEGINTSIFSSLGVDMNLYLTHEEKVDQWMSQQFGVSDDFISANIENFVLLIFSYIVLWLLYLLREKLDKKNILRRGLQNIDLPLALIGQYVAIMNGFFLIMPVIQLHSSQSTFSQKANLALHITFILISLAIVGFALSYVHQQCTRLNTKSQKEIYIFVDGQLLRQWVINCLCNSVLPGFAVFGNNILYLVFNSGLFIFLLYAGMKVKQFKLNSIILALELIIFHIAFILMTIFDSQSHPLTYHSSAACLVVIIFLGAAHEFASFIMSIIYAIYCCIKKSLNSVGDIQSSIVMEGVNVEKPEQQNDGNVFNQQAQQGLEVKPKHYNLRKLKNVQITQLPRDRLQVQSLNQTNAQTANSIYRKQHQLTKKSSNKSKKAVRFDIEEMKNHYHFQKVLTSKPQSINSPQQSDIPKAVKKSRKPYFTKYKLTKQLKGLKIQQTQSKNQSIPNIHLPQQHQKTDLPVIKHKKNLSLYGMKSLKSIQNKKKSLTPSESQGEKSSVYVLTKDIKDDFKIEMSNVEDKQPEE